MVNIEKRRLFYVAMTRAKKKLLFSYSSVNRKEKGLTISMFLSEVVESMNLVQVQGIWLQRIITFQLSLSNSGGIVYDLCCCTQKMLIICYPTLSLTTNWLYYLFYEFTKHTFTDIQTTYSLRLQSISLSLSLLYMWCSNVLHHALCK